VLQPSESGVGLLQRNNTEYEMARLHRPESFVAPPNEGGGGGGGGSGGGAVIYGNSLTPPPALH